MSKQLIFLDAGHGGKDPGAVGLKAKEKDIVLSVAMQLGQALTARGFAVCYSRTNDVRILASERARAANKAKAAAFVSIHCNAAANKAATGTETFAYGKASKGYQLACSIQKNIVKAVQLPDRGVKTANFAVLRETAMPAALVELGFLSNPIEEKFLLNSQWQQRAAAAIAEGIVQYFG